MDGAALAPMLAKLKHRGPDDEGRWGEGGVWLGQRRLAVIDLSPAGHQPMVSACGRWVVSVNGEIYNYKTLRGEVQAASGVRWRAGPATSRCCSKRSPAFGFEAALGRAMGMFAMAAWDRRDKRLLLARDRFGEKPLYYSTAGGGISFASELTALAAAPGLNLSLSPSAMSLFFSATATSRLRSLSIYDERAQKLSSPGCRVEWRAKTGARETPYWSFGDVLGVGAGQPVSDSGAAADELDVLLRDVVREQMIADVPLGVFLSGGVDSSTIAAIMRQVASGPVKTFTIGFDAPQFNEAEHAAAVARHLKTDHTEHYVSAADAQAVVPTLGAVYDEPFADASQIPTLLLAAMARRHVTVCLTGDGGDELFGGYVRYPGVPRLWTAIWRAPFRGCAAQMIAATPPAVLEGALGFLGPLAGQYASRGKLGASLPGRDLDRRQEPGGTLRADHVGVVRSGRTPHRACARAGALAAGAAGALHQRAGGHAMA